MYPGLPIRSWKPQLHFSKTDFYPRVPTQFFSVIRLCALVPLMPKVEMDDFFPAFDAQLLTYMQMSSIHMSKLQILIAQISYVLALQTQIDFLNERMYGWLYDWNQEDFDTGYRGFQVEVLEREQAVVRAEMDELAANVLCSLTLCPQTLST